MLLANEILFFLYYFPRCAMLLSQQCTRFDVTDVTLSDVHKEPIIKAFIAADKELVTLDSLKNNR